MAEYQEQSIAGKMWIRANRIVIENPREASPVVSLTEERVIYVDESNSITAPSGTMSFLFDPGEVINMYDPKTNSLIEGKTITGQDVYNAVYSYYMTKAAARDSL